MKQRLSPQSSALSPGATPDGTRATYEVLATADRARLASAQTLIAAGRSDAARAVIEHVQVLTWSAERMAEGLSEERRAA